MNRRGFLKFFAVVPFLGLLLKPEQKGVLQVEPDEEIWNREYNFIAGHNVWTVRGGKFKEIHMKDLQAKDLFSLDDGFGEFYHVLSVEGPLTIKCIKVRSLRKEGGKTLIDNSRSGSML